MTPAEHNELAILRMEVQHITVKLATTQAENRKLRKMTRYSRTGRILERTATDAKQICAWRWSGFSVSRSNCESYGLTRQRWAWAVALLERARIVEPDAKYLDDAFLLDDITDAVDAIDRTVKVLEERGLDALVMRMPRNGGGRRKRS